MNDPEDVLRSLQRYVSQILASPPWKVRVQRTRASDDQRPIAVIEESGTLTVPISRAGTLNQGDVQMQQSYAIVCYPSLEATAAQSRQEASRIRTLLVNGFSRGLVTDDDPPVNIGAPWYFPVYDYDGIPVDGDGRTAPVTVWTHAEVDNTFNARPIQDPLDELRFTVAANLRVRWWQGGRVPPATPIATVAPPAYSPGFPGDAGALP